MKKVIVTVGIVLIVILVIKKYRTYFEDIYIKVVNRISEQSWELEGKYNIDETEWFDKEHEIFSGNLSYAQLGDSNAEGLSIKAAGCRVEIIGIDEQNCYIEFTNMKKVQAYQIEEQVLVNAMRDTKWEQKNESSVLKIYVPRGLKFERVEMELGAGSIHIDQMSAKVVDISIEAGKYVADNIYADKLEIDLGAGDIQLKSCVLGDTQIDCAAGNLEMLIKGQTTDFNYKIQCVAGNIQVGEEKYSGINEEKEIDNMAAKTMDLECVVGNIIIAYEL